MDGQQFRLVSPFWWRLHKTDPIRVGQRSGIVLL